MRSHYLSGLFAPTSVAMFGAMLLLFVGQYALWVYLERIGGGAGLSLEQISTVLIANGFLSLLGPLAVAPAWQRRGTGSAIGRAGPVASAGRAPQPPGPDADANRPAAPAA